MTTKLITGFRSRATLIKDKVNSIQLPELPEKYKGTIIEKWQKYWKQLGIDYKEVFLDVGRDIKAKPKKAAIIGATLTGIYYSCKTNPDLSDFYEQLYSYSNDMGMVHESCHSKKSSEYISFINKCSNEGVLRRLTIGVVSFLWIDNYNKDLGIYKAVCGHLKPEYLTFRERIIDVGFNNVWWNLREQLKDFDIKEDE